MIYKPKTRQSPLASFYAWKDQEQRDKRKSIQAEWLSKVRSVLSPGPDRQRKPSTKLNLQRQLHERRIARQLWTV